MNTSVVYCPKCGAEQKLLFSSQVAYCERTLACRKYKGSMVAEKPTKEAIEGEQK